MEKRFTVETPIGVLVIQGKEGDSLYPGVEISLENGKLNETAMLACVEYDVSTKDLQLEYYGDPDVEAPSEIFFYADLEDKINAADEKEFCVEVRNIEIGNCIVRAKDADEAKDKAFEMWKTRDVDYYNTIGKIGDPQEV